MSSAAIAMELDQPLEVEFASPPPSARSTSSTSTSSTCSSCSSLESSDSDFSSSSPPTAAAVAESASLKRLDRLAYLDLQRFVGHSPTSSPSSSETSSPVAIDSQADVAEEKVDDFEWGPTIKRLLAAAPSESSGPAQPSTLTLPRVPASTAAKAALAAPPASTATPAPQPSVDPHLCVCVEGTSTPVICVACGDPLLILLSPPIGTARPIPHLNYFQCSRDPSSTHSMCEACTSLYVSHCCSEWALGRLPIVCPEPSCATPVPEYFLRELMKEKPRMQKEYERAVRQAGLMDAVTKAAMGRGEGKGRKDIEMEYATIDSNERRSSSSSASTASTATPSSSGLVPVTCGRCGIYTALFSSDYKKELSVWKQETVKRSQQEQRNKQQEQHKLRLQHLKGESRVVEAGKINPMWVLDWSEQDKKQQPAEGEGEEQEKGEEEFEEEFEDEKERKEEVQPAQVNGSSSSSSSSSSADPVASAMASLNHLASRIQKRSASTTNKKRGATPRLSPGSVSRSRLRPLTTTPSTRASRSRSPSPAPAPASLSPSVSSPLSPRSPLPPLPSMPTRPPPRRPACPSTCQFFDCQQEGCSASTCLACDAVIDYSAAAAHDCSTHLLKALYGELVERLTAACTRGCARCGRRGQKDYQCNNMTCDGCGANWCYCCGMDKSEMTPDSRNNHNSFTFISDAAARCPAYLQSKYGVRATGARSIGEAVSTVQGGTFNNGDAAKALRFFHLDLQVQAFDKWKAEQQMQSLDHQMAVTIMLKTYFGGEDKLFDKRDLLNLNRIKTIWTDYTSAYRRWKHSPRFSNLRAEAEICTALATEIKEEKRRAAEEKKERERAKVHEELEKLKKERVEMEKKARAAKRERSRLVQKQREEERFFSRGAATARGGQEQRGVARPMSAGARASSGSVTPRARSAVVRNKKVEEVKQDERDYVERKHVEFEDGNEDSTRATPTRSPSRSILRHSNSERTPLRYNAHTTPSATTATPTRRVQSHTTATPTATPTPRAASSSSRSSSSIASPRRSGNVTPRLVPSSTSPPTSTPRRSPSTATVSSSSSSPSPSSSRRAAPPSTASSPSVRFPPVVLSHRTTRATEVRAQQVLQRQMMAAREEERAKPRTRQLAARTSSSSSSNSRSGVASTAAARIAMEANHNVVAVLG